jgi:hypothetical protein
VAKITILVSINQFNINTIKLINSHVNTPLINQYSIDDKSGWASLYGTSSQAASLAAKARCLTLTTT